MKIKDVIVKVKAGPADGLEEGQFAAYASVFGNEDSYGDVVVKGAFADTLAEWAAGEAPIPLLWGHNFADPDYNIGHVANAVEDDHGLLVTGELDLESPKSAQVYRLLKSGRVRQMSFAYDVLDGGPVTVDGQSFYELRKLRLHEVSVVPLGANQETEVLAVKAATEILAEGVKAGRMLSTKNESAIRAAHESLGKVLDILGTDPDQEKASGTAEAKSVADDEEPSPAKSSAADEEPTPSPSAVELADVMAFEIEVNV